MGSTDNGSEMTAAAGALAAAFVPKTSPTASLWPLPSVCMPDRIRCGLQFGLDAPPTAPRLRLPGDEFKVYATESAGRVAAQEAEAGLRQARLADMTASGSMVTLSRYVGGVGGGGDADSL